MDWTKNIWLFLMLGIWITSCSDDSGIVNPSDIRIYAQKTQEVDVLASDIKPIGGNDFLIFGVCGNAPETRFDGDGSIYFRRINSFGETLWDTCYTVTGNNGFPSNLIKTSENTFSVFWNELTEGTQVLLEINLQPSGIEVSIPQPIVNCNFNCGPIIDASLSGVDSAINLVGVGYDFITNQSITYISQYGFDLRVNAIRSQRPFISENFGGVGQSDLNLLKNVDGFLSVHQTSKRLVFTGPLGEKMSLGQVGESNSIYQDDFFWIASLTINDPLEDKASLVLSSPGRPDNPSFFFPEIDLDVLPSQMNIDLLRIQNKSFNMFNLDPNFPIFMESITNSLRKIIVGTSRTGQPIIYAFDGFSLEPIELGDISPYLVGAVSKSGNEANIILVGTTKIERREQSIFIIKLNINELFQ